MSFRVVPSSVSLTVTDPSGSAVSGTTYIVTMITGIRFYKVPDNTGTHTGTLWSSTGTALATGT